MKKYTLLLAVLLTFNAFPVLSQESVILLDYDLTNYSEVKSKFFAFDENSLPNYSILSSQLALKENGVTLPIKQIEHPENLKYDSISVVIAFDLAINSRDDANANFALAKTMAGNLVSKFDYSTSEIAITSFDRLGYLNYDFSKDMNELQAAIDPMISARASDFNAGLISMPTGAINIAAKGLSDKSIILFTDGKSSLDADQIIADANKYSINIYCVSIGYKVPDNLRRISDETGGFAFEYVDDTNSLGVENALLAYANGYQASTLYWDGETYCAPEVEVVLDLFGTTESSKLVFKMPEEYKPRIGANPPYLGFSGVFPKPDKELKIILEAINSDIIVFETKIDPPFSISSGNISSETKITLGNPHELTIKYTPEDSSIVFRLLEIVSDACSGTTISITGGYPNSKPKVETLRFTKPELGDVAIVGDTTHVRWTGLLPDDVIQLEFSLDDQKTWDTLANDVNGLLYIWDVPDTTSDECWLRAKQLWPNNIDNVKYFEHPQKVNSAVFNKEGNLMVTSCSDHIARLYNTNNGKLIKEFSGHTLPLTWAAIDITNTMIATSSEDLTAIVWDIETGDEILKITEHTKIVRAINFSPDGKKVVTIGHDGQAFVWDIETGNKDVTLCCINSPLWYGVYNSVGDKILLAGSGARAAIHNAINGDVEKEFIVEPTKVITIQYASWSEDDSKIVTADWFGYATVWDVTTGDSLYKVQHFEGVDAQPLSCANFDYDAKQLITSSATSSIANVWDGTTHELVYQLKEHTNAVKTAFFNFDASRILSAGLDDVAILRNVDTDRIGLQTATTDFSFEIARAEISAIDIEFDDLAVNELADSIAYPFITNETNYKFEVKKITKSGTNASEFSIIEDEAPYYLDPNEKRQIELRFAPTTPDFKEAQLEIIIPGDTLVKKLEGLAFEPGLVPNEDFIIFGEVEVGDFRDSTAKIIVKNNSGMDVKIDSIKLVGPEYEQYEILDGGNGSTIAKGGGHEMTIRFAPVKTGRVNGRVKFWHDGLGSVTYVNLFGDGIIPTIDTATVAIKNFRAVAGETIDVPIYIKNVSESGLDHALTGFSLDLRFNSSLLMPVDFDFTSEIIGDEKVIHFEIPSSFGADSILATIKFTAALGNDTTTNVILENLAPIGRSKIILAEESAVFSLDGVCEEGGPRLFDMRGEIQISGVAPNPVFGTSKVEFETIEPGFTTLKLIDISGNLVQTLAQGNLSAKVHDSYIDASRLAAGSYILILETPTITLTKKIEIAK
jgi:WD40 repeat protein